MEGVERYKVRLLPHNPAWDEEFLQVKEELSACWPENIQDIQHVGSTAIPAICAKPILDVAVKMKSIASLNTEALVQRGYSYCGPCNASGSYHLFVLRGEDGISLRHIHCYAPDEPEFGQVVGFRDYLNAHPETARQYEALKRTLSAQYADNRAQYTAGKEAFILSVYKRMEESK